MYNQNQRYGRHNISIMKRWNLVRRVMIALKSRLTLVASKLGNITSDEIGKMVVIVLHTRKWDPVGRDWEKYNASLECIDIATGTNLYISIDQKRIINFCS